MAHYHLSVKVLSRSTRNTVSALAYRAGTQLTCERTGERFDYTGKKVDHVELILPHNAPLWIKALQQELSVDRQKGLQKLSDCLEAAEKRVDSQVYRELEFSLPRELTDAQNKELATDFLKRECASLGMGVITNFHFDVDDQTGDRKPHCHALLFMRELTHDGFSELKNRTWNSKEQHARFREAWAEIQNEHLEKHGVIARVDHRSYEKQGIDLEPQMKKGKAVTERLKKGLPSFVGDEFDKIQSRNLFRINARPEIVFDIVTKDQSTFQWEDVQKVVHRYADSLDTFHRLTHKLAGSKNLIALQDGVYTTASLLKIEHQTEEDLLALKDLKSTPVAPKIVDHVLKKHDAVLQAYGGLTSPQKDVIKGLVSPERLKTLVGYAGAGKSTSLSAAKDMWEASGCHVVGLAPTRKAAQNLTELEIKSFTVAKFLRSYEQGRSQYKKSTVFLVDEVGLIDSRTLRSLVQAVTTLKAKVVFVGDPRQLQPISAGPVFRRLLEKVPPLVLTQVLRQKEAWAREASQKFGDGQVREALEPYVQRGALELVQEIKEVAVSDQASDAHVLSTYAYTKQVTGLVYHQITQDLKTQGYPEKTLSRHLKDHALYPTFKSFQGVREKAKDLCQTRGLDLEEARPTGYRSATKEKMVSDWLKDRQNSPESSALMVATTRVDVADLNHLAKTKLQEAGEVASESRSFTTIELQEDDFGRTVARKSQGDFSVGDQIMFRRNDQGLKVDNGMLGKITSLEKHKIKVQLLGTEDREVSFAPKLYPYFKHGWASTAYTIQGTTYDRVYALLDRTQNRNTSYVMMTRHRDAFKGYAPSDEFANLKEVVDTLAMSGEKLLAHDYLKTQEVKALLHSEETFLEKASQTVEKVKDLGHAVKGFLGLTKNRQSLSDIDTLYSSTESLRAIGVLKETPIDRKRAGEAARENSSLPKKQALSFKGAPFLEEKQTTSQAPALSQGKETPHEQDLKNKEAEPQKDSPQKTFKAPQETSLETSQETGALQTPEAKGLALTVVSQEGITAPQEDTQASERHGLSQTPEAAPSGRSSAPKRARPSVDVKALNDRICESVDLERLGRDLGLIEGTGRSERQGQVRYGTKGSFSINLHKNVWHDFETGAGGNAFSMLKEAGHRGSYSDQSRTLSDYTDGSVSREIDAFLEGRELSQKTHKDFEARRHARETREAARQKEAEALGLQKQDAIRALVEKSTSLEGTQAETYLREERGLTGPFPNSLRGVTPGTSFAYPDGKGGVTEKKIPFGAMLSLATDKEGTLKAVQLTYLNGKEKRGRTQDGTKLPKLTFGAPKGAFVDLSLEKAENRSDIVFLAEGVETALSVKQAGAPRVLASLGITNLKNFETEAKRVVLCADWDGSPTLPKALHTAQARFQEKGQQGDILLPVASGAQKKDFNDLLLEGGLKKVQDCVTPFLEEKDRDPNPFKAIPSLCEPETKKEISLSEIAQESKASGLAAQPSVQEKTTTTPVEKAPHKEAPSSRDEHLWRDIERLQKTLQNPSLPLEAEIKTEQRLHTFYKEALRISPTFVETLKLTEGKDLLETLAREVAQMPPPHVSEPQRFSPEETKALLERLDGCQEAMKIIDQVPLEKEYEIRGALWECYKEVLKDPAALSHLEKKDPKAFKEVKEIQKDQAREQQKGWELSL